MLFWMAFHQNGSTLSLWARDNTNRTITLWDFHLRPFLFTIPVTGERPILYSVDGLPAGLQLDLATGIITGALKEKGAHVVTLHAKNALGSDKRQLKIVCGDEQAR